jgi:hypothetical protein
MLLEEVIFPGEVVGLALPKSLVVEIPVRAVQLGRGVVLGGSVGTGGVPVAPPIPINPERVEKPTVITKVGEGYCRTEPAGTETVQYKTTSLGMIVGSPAYD